jgi:glycoside/pentoside/hexuronide:cation symporter, GPH family
VTAQRFSGWHRWTYSLCNVGIAVGTVPTTLLLLYYLTQVAGLRASVAGLVVALPKIWDALVDPMFGGWVDRFSVRIGGRSRVVLIAGIGFVGTLGLTFSLPQIHSSMQILVMVTLLQIISSTSQTALGVTQFALATEMTETPIGLSKLLSLAVVLSQILSVVFSILAPLLVAWSGGGSAGYSRMAAEMAALTGVALLGFMLVTRAVPVGKRSAASEAMPTWAALRATLSNRPFYFLIAFVLFTNTSVAILFGFLPFANQYVLGGNASGLSMLEGVLGVTVLLGMLLAPEFVRRLDAVVSMRICNLVVAGMSGLLFVASFGPIWTTWAVLAGAGLAAGVIGVLVQTATLIATGLELKKSVVVSMGFYLGIMLSGMKIGNSLGGFVSGQLLELVGFVSGNAQQSPTTLMWLRAGYTLVPVVFTLIAGVFLQRVRLPIAPPATTNTPDAALTEPNQAAL